MSIIRKPGAQSYYNYILKYKFNSDFQLLELNKCELGECPVKLEILYKNNHLHIIKLVKKEKDFYWEMFPYNGDCYCSKALHPDTFPVVLQAIEEHSTIYLKIRES